MNYIYDILLNYNNFVYEFFEWEDKDYILHVRKIPLFRMTTKDLYNLANYKIKIEPSFLEKIYKRTEIFTKNNVEAIDYAFIATDKKEVIAFKLDNKGYIKKYSKLIFEEAKEVIEYSYSLELSCMKYEILSKITNSFRTRNEENIKNYIIREINKIIKNNDIDKIKYLYLECFGKVCDDKKIKNFLNELNANWENVYCKIYDFLKMTISKR